MKDEDQKIVAKISIFIDEDDMVTVDTSECPMSLTDQLEILRVAYTLKATQYNSMMTLGDNGTLPS